MGIVKAIAGIFRRKEESAQENDGCAAEQNSAVDCQPYEASDITLGVKYANRFAWQITPPAGWRRQENTSGIAWPNGGVSPTVSFTNPNLQTGEQGMIRWQLMSTEESPESHQALADLFSGNVRVTLDSLLEIEAPGLVKGTKIQSAELVELPGRQQAIVLQSRLDQCRGEQPIFRYILLFPDRRVGNSWFRETLQFMATENAFWETEKLAIAALRTFRRNPEDQTATGSYTIPASLTPGR